MTNTNSPHTTHGPDPSCLHTIRPQVKQLFTKPCLDA